MSTYDVFVGNLNSSTTEEQLRELFSEFGTIHSVLLKKGDKGDELYFSFVRFLKENEAQNSVAGLNGKMVNGIPIKCQLSQKRGPAGGKFGNNQFGGPGNKFGGNGPAGGGFNKPAVLNADIGNFGAQHAGNQNIRSVELSKLGTMSVMVTHVDSPLKCYVQSLDPQHQQEMNNIAEQLANFCPSAQPVQGKPQPDKIYASRFTSDGFWYRCKVNKELSDTETFVDYIDYGNGEAKPNCDIVELLPKLANIKVQALGVMLFGLKPLYGCNNATGTARLMELTTDKELKCQFQTASAKITGPFLPAILTDEQANHDINQVMLDDKYGERRFNLPVRTPPTGQNPNRPNAQLSKIQPKGPSPARGNIGNGDEFSNTLSSLEHTSFSWVGGNPPAGMGAQPIAAIAPMSIGAGMPPVIGHGQPAGDSAGYAQEVQVIRAEANLMRLDLQRQCERLQRELNTKNDEISHLQFEQSNVATKMQKPQIFPDLSHMRNLVSSVQQVKLLRQQFPTGEQSVKNCDVIEQGLALFADPDLTINTENLEIVGQVKSALDSYNFLQLRVKSAKDLSEVADMLPARDEARKQLFNRLTEFHAALSELPVLQRKTQLEECVSLLRKTYNSYLEVKVLTELSAEGVTNMYGEWKSAKVAEFSDARTITNTEHNAVNSALLLAQQQLSLGESSADDDRSSSLPNVDSLFTSFQKALVSEITTTNMLESKDDGPKICMMVQSLNQVLQAELAQISSLYDLQTTYTQLHADVEPWLQTKPDIMPINVTRKNIKDLKKKLRHKLADKVDLEEDCPSDDELHDLLKEISHIRMELQTAFTTEDGIIVNLSDINDKHFPELCLQHPDVGIDQSETFGGLVKLGWSLDHFDAIQTDFMGKSSLTKSTFCGEPVVIREYIIDEGLGIKKTDVLRRAASQLKSDKILQIKGVFFSKTERQVYMVLPYHNQSLAERLLEPLSPNQALVIIRDLVEVVKHVHDNRLMHGAIHPNNVFVTAEGDAVLGDYDFTKKLEQRAEKIYISRKGLTFAAPEVTSRSIVTRATDMYSLGVIAYWLHFSEASTLSEFVKSQENDPLEQLLHYLLNPDPQRRCSASEALNLPYFNVPVAKEEQSASLPLTVSTLSEANESRQMSPKPNSGILKTALSPRSSVSGVAKVSYGDTTVFKVETTSSEDESTVATISEEAAQEVEGPSTPLPCSTMGTPVNTPVEGDSQAQKAEQSTAVHDLVTSAAEQAAALLTGEPGEYDASSPPVMSAQDILAQTESLENEDDIVENGAAEEAPHVNEDSGEMTEAADVTAKSAAAAEDDFTEQLVPNGDE